jgi:hypothetical protein
MVEPAHSDAAGYTVSTKNAPCGAFLANGTVVNFSNKNS